MEITNFNFLPSAYDKIIYIAEGFSTQVNGVGNVKTVYTNGIGFFFPLVIMSTDQENWYSLEYPPQDDQGSQTMSGQVNVYGDRFTFTGYINAAQTGTHNIYFKLLGIEI